MTETMSPIARLNLAHLAQVKGLRGKIEKKTAELIERQQKTRSIHQIMQEINNYTDQDNKLDLTNHPELIEKLKEVKEKYGINISIEKTKFTDHERTRLLDNLNFSVQDWDTENNLDLKKLASLSAEYDQSILMIKSAMAGEERICHEINRHIAGS